MNPGYPKFDVDPAVIDEYRDNGHGWEEIAAMLGTTSKTLRQWRSSNNYEDRFGRAIYGPDIDREVVDDYRLKGHKWEDIAAMLGLSSRALRKWRTKTNYVDPGNAFDDDVVDQIITDFKRGQPRIGEVITIAHVQGVHGILGKRRQFRESIARVDNDNLDDRREQFGKRLKRRAYDVVIPHALWHMDGWHKLIRYKFVVHGCIDGATRAIIYATIADNNRCTTPFTSFLAGVEEFGTLPSRMRGDYGGENVKVADYMIEHRGLDRGSYIFGSSRHNTRIERLWGDLRKDALEYWMDFFKDLETYGINIDNDWHMACLHYVFMGRIQADLNNAKTTWNNHKISTEGNKTPLQLLDLRGDLIDEFVVEEEYGVDPDVDADEEEQEEEQGHLVVVEPPMCPLDAELWAAFQQAAQPINPLGPKDSKETMIDQYFDALQILYEIGGLL